MANPVRRRVHGAPREPRVHAWCACAVYVRNVRARCACAVCVHGVRAWCACVVCVRGERARPHEPAVKQLSQRRRRVSALSRVRAAEHGHAPHAEVVLLQLDAVCARAGRQLAWPAADRTGPLRRAVLQRWLSPEGGVASRDAVTDECDAPRPRPWERAVRHRRGAPGARGEQDHWRRAYSTPRPHVARCWQFVGSLAASHPLSDFVSGELWRRHAAGPHPGQRRQGEEPARVGVDTEPGRRC